MDAALLAKHQIIRINLKNAANFQPQPDIDRRKSTISLDQTYSTDEDDMISLADKIPSGDYQEYLNTYEDKIMLTDAINQLKPKLKEVIELNYYDDMSQRQIAEKLNISQMQVSRRIKQALEEIYKNITKTRDK